jgi:hypothetical protein
MAEIHSLDPSDVSPIDPRAWAIVGLNADDVIEETVSEVQEEIAEAEKLFLGK